MIHRDPIFENEREEIRRDRDLTGRVWLVGDIGGHEGRPPSVEGEQIRSVDSHALQPQERHAINGRREWPDHHQKRRRAES